MADTGGLRAPAAGVDMLLRIHADAELFGGGVVPEVAEGVGRPRPRLPGVGEHQAICADVVVAGGEVAVVDAVAQAGFGVPAVRRYPSARYRGSRRQRPTGSAGPRPRQTRSGRADSRGTGRRGWW